MPSQSRGSEISSRVELIILMTNVSEFFKHVYQLDNIRFEIVVMVIPHSLQVKLFLDILFTLIVLIRYITVIQLGTEFFVGRQLNFFSGAQVVVWIHTFSRD